MPGIVEILSTLQQIMKYNYFQFTFEEPEDP